MSFGSKHYLGGRDSRNNPFRHSDAPKPKKEVHPTGEIAHLWAHATQSRARNPQGNLFFEGATIYSYRRSWPLATIYTKPKDTIRATEANALVLTNSGKYGPTTTGHQSDANQAVSHLTQIAVPNPTSSLGEMDKFLHDDNLKYLRSEADSELARAGRAMTSWRVEISIERAALLYKQIAHYMRFFGIRRKAPQFPQAIADAALARINRILNPDPVRDARKIRAAKQRADKTRTALQAVFDNYSAQVETYNAAVRAARAALPAAPTMEQMAQHWRETGQWLSLPEVSVDAPYPHAHFIGQPYGSYWKVERKLRTAGFEMPHVESAHGTYARPETVLLRVTGEEIVTSMGARVPVAAAPMVWTLVQRALRSGGWKASGLMRPSIGHYPLDEIQADGTLRAGCHTIKFDELQRMARTLNLDNASEETNG